MHLPNGKDVTIDLAWPKMTADASDLEFGVTITPDRKVVTKFGWEWAGVKKVYLDVVGNNPWIGDYKLSRKGEFEEISASTPGTCMLTPSYGSPLLARSTDSPLPMTSFYFWPVTSNFAALTYVNSIFHSTKNK